MNKYLAVRLRRMILLLFLLVSLSAAAGEFPLIVNDISGLKTSWPLVAGLPFFEGEIKDVSSIRIMSGEKEVPSQVDVAATWRDGSIRWALAGFTASPQGKYGIEYGQGVKRMVHPAPLKVTLQTEGGFTVDTGAAVYQFEGDKLLPEKGWLGSGTRRRLILEGSGAGTYLVDNAGRTARVAGQGAEIENKILKEGPGRFVVKRSGWYVTDIGEKLARADVWFYFSAGVPYFKITHSLILTEDTNRVWFKDYGLEFKIPDKPSVVYCAVEEEGQEVRKIANYGEEIFMLQSDYPHFAERICKAAIGSLSKGQEKVMEEIKVAGDWAHGDYGNYGITIVMPWLAERFPKEISFGQRGARAVLWSGLSGKELDFRTRTLVEEYFQDWVKKGIYNSSALMDTPSNAQGTARTHDLWILPQAGVYNAELVNKSAMAAARTVLVMADPKWLCATEAIGWPMYHKDTEKFPGEEKLMSDCWERILLPLKAFPMNGFIAWGCYPDQSYRVVDNRIMAASTRLKSLAEYGLRQAPMRMYARSGDRTYYEYGYRFGRFTGDYGVAHWNAPGKKRGGFIHGGNTGGIPLFWQLNTVQYGIIDGTIRHWLHDYYLLGDERSLDIMKMIKESILKAGEPGGLSVIKTLLAVSIYDWDERTVAKAHNYIHSIIDPASQNGIKDRGGYGPMYKDEGDTCDFLEYYLETGDEAVKEAFLKLLDHRYRFDRRYNPLGHRNYDAFTHAVAYQMTGDERFRRVVEQSLGDALYYSRKHPLAEELAAFPKDPLDWKVYPYNTVLGQHEYHFPFMGIPTSLKLIAEKGQSGKRTPIVIKPMAFDKGKILFSHCRGKETVLSIQFTATRNDAVPRVVSYPGGEDLKFVSDVKVVKQKRIQWPPRLVLRHDNTFHMYVTISSNVPDGLYLLNMDGDERFTLLDITGDKAALYCPEGFWSPSGGPIQRLGEGTFGRAGEGIPLFFLVPSGLKDFEILLASPALVKRPDGSVAVELSEKNIGKLKIPVEGKGGVWSIEPNIRSFRGDCLPAFYRLFNVEPIVAFGSPDLLPGATTGKPAGVSSNLPAPMSAIEFLPGIQGKTLRLSGNQALKFSRGIKVPQGGYAYFPGMTGTVEFWFRADRPTWEVPIKVYESIDFPFIRGPHINIHHKYWIRGSARHIFSMFQLELLHAGKIPLGFQASHFFRAEEWTHIACTWNITDGTKDAKRDFTIFVNGKKLSHEQATYGLNLPTGQQKLEFLDSEPEMTLGPFEGSMDILRLSDVVRYKENFIPPKTAPPVDENTRALFLFDEGLKGISAFSPEQVEMRFIDN